MRNEYKCEMQNIIKKEKCNLRHPNMINEKIRKRKDN